MIRKWCIGMLSVWALTALLLPVKALAEEVGTPPAATSMEMSAPAPAAPEVAPAAPAPNLNSYSPNLHFL